MQTGRHVTGVVATALGVIAFIGVAATDVAAQGQPWEDYGYIGINYGYLVADRTFSESLSETIFEETATSTTTHSSTGGGALDIGGAVRVWRNLAAGVSVTSFSGRSGAATTASVPHPLFFNRNRTAVTNRNDLDYKELGIHLQGIWVMPITEKITVAVGGGPSFFNVDQSLITSVVPSELGAPFNTVSIAASAATASESAVGGNIGADVMYWVNERFGGGIFLRYAAASVDLAAAGGTQSIDVGGFMSGIGFRIRLPR